MSISFPCVFAGAESFSPVGVESFIPLWEWDVKKKSKKKEGPREEKSPIEGGKRGREEGKGDKKKGKEEGKQGNNAPLMLLRNVSAKEVGNFDDSGPRRKRVGPPPKGFAGRCKDGGLRSWASLGPCLLYLLGYATHIASRFRRMLLSLYIRIFVLAGMLGDGFEGCQGLFSYY